MPRIDPKDPIHDFNLLNDIKNKLEAHLAECEREIGEIKKELDAIAVLERSKYLSSTSGAPNQQHSLFKKITIKDRMLTALDTLPERFTRGDLFEAVKADGKGEVNEGSMSVFFPIMIKEGSIEQIEKARGNYPGQYSKGRKTA